MQRRSRRGTSSQVIAPRYSRLRRRFSPQFSNPPLVISNKNRGEPGIASISIRSRVRSSILLSKISANRPRWSTRHARDGAIDRKIQPGTQTAWNRSLPGLSLVESRGTNALYPRIVFNRPRKPGDFLKRDEGSRRICRGERVCVAGCIHMGRALRASRLKASNHTDVRTAAARHGSAFLVCWKCEVEELNRISTSMPRKQPVEWDSFGNTQSRAEIRTPVQPWNAI